MEDKRQAELESVRAFVTKIQDLTTNVYIGVDTGAEGAIGIVCGKRAVVVDIPTYKLERRYTKKLNKKERLKTGKKTKSVKGEKTVFDYQGIVAIFRALKPVKDRIHICVEEAQIMVKSRGGGKGAGGQNAYGAYRVGFGYGLFPLYITSRGWPAEYPVPFTWKNEMGLKGKDKNYSLRKAKNLFPGVPLPRKKDHNRAEALLLAQYMKKLYG